MATKRFRRYLDRELSRISRAYVAEWRVLNAVNYGVPQKRERLIIIGIRRDLGLRPSFPKTTHGEKSWITLREAIGDLLALPPAKGNTAEPIVPDHIMTPRGGWDNPRSDWGSRVMSLERPAYTITEKHRSGQLVPVPHTSLAMYRRLTVRECLRIQSFPDWWRFPEHVSVSKRYRLVGEAMPPILAYRLAVAIARVLGLETRESPREEEWQLPYFKRAFADYFGG